MGFGPLRSAAAPHTSPQVCFADAVKANEERKREETNGDAKLGQRHAAERTFREHQAANGKAQLAGLTYLVIYTVSPPTAHLVTLGVHVTRTGANADSKVAKAASTNACVCV